MSAVKIVEVLGVSSTSWDAAAAAALEATGNSIRNISGIEIINQTAKVKDGKISEYHTTCKIAFRVD